MSIHGSGYWYHRHDDLNANTWINNVRGLPRSSSGYNDPGYTIGGPVYIPKLMQHSRNKLFFFWSQECQRQLLAERQCRTRRFRQPLERNGDFSQSVDNNGQPLTVLERYRWRHLSRATSFPPEPPLHARRGAPEPYPLPKYSGQADTTTVRRSQARLPRREDLLRLDYNASDKLRFFGHWITNEFPQVNLSPYGSFVLGPTVPIASDHRYSSRS